MERNIGKIALIIREYDEAISWYSEKLNFHVIEDNLLDDKTKKRWVSISPNLKSGFQLLLAKADSEDQLSFIGKQSGGRVFLFFYTDNFLSDYQLFRE